LQRTWLILGRRSGRAQRRLIAELIKSAPNDYPPSPDWLVAYFLQSRSFVAASAARIKNPQSMPIVLKPARFAPAARFAELDVPKLVAPGDLAEWLGISPDQLDWLSDSKRQHGLTDIPILQHYRYAFAPKKSGPPRLLEIPKPRLMAIQRRILHEILDVVPPHDCAHGFVAGRSCHGAAQIHAGESIVVAADLKSFFLNTRLSRVHATFRSLGYPAVVARLLTGLCSSATPKSVFARLPAANRHDWSTQRTYQSPHLPQGAPTSPALANLAAWRLDTRLLGLARSFGANYTRYADDLAFSGDAAFAERLKSFLAAVEDIVRDEGFVLNAAKTRVMRRGARQEVTGIVVNDHVNVRRVAYDTLKATLHNCIKNGPAVENRGGVRDFRAHLDGRIGWVENVNPSRAKKLRRMFDAIRWEAPA
jgi:hypothetical protein